jgi:hypothetical protein
MSNNYFDNKNPIVRELYDSLVKTLQKEIKDYQIENKKTSVHMVAKSAFLGIHFMKSALVTNIVLNHPLDTKRLHKVEQISKSRFHNEIKLTSLDDINDELIQWIKEAYLLKK